MLPSFMTGVIYSQSSSSSVFLKLNIRGQISAAGCWRVKKTTLDRAMINQYPSIIFSDFYLQCLLRHNTFNDLHR